MTRSPTLAPSALSLLAVGLRTRATSAAALAEFALRDPQGIQEDLALLESLGYLVISEGSIWYPNPETVLAKHTSQLLTAAEEVIERQIGAARKALESLPGLLSEWHAGEPTAATDHAEVVHDGHAAIDLWFAQREIHAAASTCAVMPESGRSFEADPKVQEAWYATFSGRPDTLRLILGADDLAHPEATQAMAPYLADGYQIRVMQQPPSWFWIIDDTIAAIPLTWGEKWPTSAVIIRSKAMISLIQGSFDQLWSEAVPLQQEGDSWDSLLALMCQGATLESASESLGISARTGRRRVAEAMEHYDVRGQVSLGAAWKLAQTRTGY